MPEEDGFVKLDPVLENEEEEEYILDGEIAYVEEENEEVEDFVSEDEVTNQRGYAYNTRNDSDKGVK